MQKVVIWTLKNCKKFNLHIWLIIDELFYILFYRDVYVAVLHIFKNVCCMCTWDQWINWNELDWSYFRLKLCPRLPEIFEVEDRLRVRQVAEQRFRLVDVFLRSCQQIGTNRETPEIGRIREQRRLDSEKKNDWRKSI